MVLYYILLPFAWLLWHLGFRIRVEGRENLKKVQTKGYILAPTHVSAIDPVFIAVTRWGGRMVIFAKKELFEINAFLSWFFRCAGAVCVRGTKEEVAVIAQTVEACKNGRTLLIFPEGTREKEGKLLPPRRLSKATKLVAGGRAGIRIRKRSKDEIGVLAEDFNRMSTSLNRTMKELEEKTKSQEMFTNNFAHELKTPLTSMIGYADLIRSNQLSEEKLITYANQIVVEGRRLEKMSMKLMDLIVLKKQDFLFYDMDITIFAEAVYETLLPVAGKYGVELTVNVQPAIVRLEPDLMKTVLINLFDNARKSMDGKGKISLFGVWVSDEYRIGIKDNGCGIDEENLSRLTEAFYMVDKSRSRANGGAGLGLAICNEIVKLHQAKLQIMSKKGIGTQVSVCFPKEVCRQVNSEKMEMEEEV